MRSETDRAKVEAFMTAFGHRVRGEGRIYLTGGATAVLFGWRPMTIDVDLKPDPEPPGCFEAIAALKEELDLNVELAAPDQFLPELPGWRERSLFIGRQGAVEFFHYDLYSQALAKIERGHARDLADLQAMARAGLLRGNRLRDLFQSIEPRLIRFPAINPGLLRTSVRQFCDALSREDSGG
jgi:hypothetical protein